LREVIRGADDTGGRVVVVVVVGRVVDVVDELVAVGRVVDVVDVEVVDVEVVEVDVEVVEVDVEVVEVDVELVVVEVLVDVVVGATAVSWWTKASVCELVSPATRLDAEESKPLHAPSPLIADPVDGPFASPPAASTLTRVVAPVDRSCTNTSRLPLVSPGTRFVANDSNATLVPSPLIAGPSSALELLPLAWFPALSTLTRVIALVAEFTTKTSPVLFVSPGTRSVPAASKATRLPSALTSGLPLPPCPLFPNVSWLVVPACRSRRKTCGSCEPLHTATVSHGPMKAT
jgi:hypothetical protein